MTLNSRSSWLYLPSAVRWEEGEELVLELEASVLTCHHWELLSVSCSANHACLAQVSRIVLTRSLQNLADPLIQGSGDFLHLVWDLFAWLIPGKSQAEILWSFLALCWLILWLSLFKIHVAIAKDTRYYPWMILHLPPLSQQPTNASQGRESKYMACMWPLTFPCLWQALLIRIPSPSMNLFLPIFHCFCSNTCSNLELGLWTCLPSSFLLSLSIHSRMVLLF